MNTQNNETPPPRQGEARRITLVDVEAVKLSQAWTSVDLHWFSAGASRLWKLDNQDDREKPLADPTMSMLFRYVLAHPGQAFVPPMRARPADVNGKVADLLKSKFPAWGARHFGVLLGCSPLSGHAWQQADVSLSVTTLRLMHLLDHAIDYRGKGGLLEFLALVLAEADSRGIPEGALWASGWGSPKQAAPGGGRTTAAVIDEVRAKCGLDTADLQWTGGSLNRRERILFGPQRDEPIHDPTVAILWRYLAAHPEDHPLPPMPTPHETQSVLAAVMRRGMRGGKYCKRRIAQLLGCTGMSSYNWLDGSESMSGSVKRLALLLVNAINAGGRQGFDRYLDVVEEEAVARGIPSLEDLFRDEWKAWLRDGVGKHGKPATP